MPRSPLRTARWVVPVLALGSLVPLAAGSAASNTSSTQRFAQLSPSVATRYYLTHPQQAPDEVRPGYENAAATLAAARAQAATSRPGRTPTGLLRFNADRVGLPQNEESVSACWNRPATVLGGTNDYRGLLDPLENFTGFYLSLDGGKTLAKEGLLPPIKAYGVQVPSGGDPVDVAAADCSALYAADLNYDPNDLNPNGVGLYRTTPATLAGCPGGTDPSCWPQRVFVAKTNDPKRFLDKPWMTVGRSGGRDVVWVTYTDFSYADNAQTEQVGASIKAVRCSTDLTHCTAPILISGGDKDVQFSDVTIGADGRTYITWSQIKGELTGKPQTFIHKLRVAQAGSTSFGPTRVVYTETRAIPFGGHLHANGFRIATYPKNVVKYVNGKPRVFVTWDACRVRIGGTVCEESQIKLTYSDDFGATWSPVQVISVGNDNYFPTISKDRFRDRLVVAYYTNRFDPVFHNRQDVELVTIASKTGKVVSRKRVTPFSNETEADPHFNDGRFIGDYIEVYAARGTSYVHFNANYVSVRYLGKGVPVPQQDNFLARVR